MPTLRIVHSAFPEVVGRGFDLARTPASIGREPGNEIVVEDDSMSRRHAQVIQTEAGYVLMDTNSANGVWVGGDRVQQVVLQPGTPVRVGNTIFELEEGNWHSTMMMAPLCATGHLPARPTAPPLDMPPPGALLQGTAPRPIAPHEELPSPTASPAIVPSAPSRRHAVPAILAAAAGVGFLIGAGWVFLRDDILAWSASIRGEQAPPPQAPAPLSFAIPGVGAVVVDVPADAGGDAEIRSQIRVSMGAAGGGSFAERMAKTPAVADDLEARVRSLPALGGQALHPLWGMPLLAGAPKQPLWPGPIVLEPAGAEFANPVTIRIPVADPPAHLSTATLLVMHRSGEAWEAVTNAVYDAPSRTVEANVEHFSELVAWAVDPSRYPTLGMPVEWSDAMEGHHGKLDADLPARFAGALACGGVSWAEADGDPPSLSAVLGGLAFDSGYPNTSGERELAAWIRGVGGERRKDENRPRVALGQLFARAVERHDGDILASLLAAHNVLRDGGDDGSIQLAMEPLLDDGDDGGARARLFGAAAYGYVRRYRRGSNLAPVDWAQLLAGKLGGEAGGETDAVASDLTPDAHLFAVDKLGLQIGEELYEQVHGRSRGEVIAHYTIDCATFEDPDAAAPSRAAARTGTADSPAEPKRPRTTSPKPAPKPAESAKAPAPEGTPTEPPPDGASDPEPNEAASAGDPDLPG